MGYLKLFQENIVALAIFFAFIGMSVIFWRERGNSARQCLDLITAPNGRYSRTAIGQCFGILLAIFAPIYTTLKGNLDAVIFGSSLLYLGGVEMYSIWMRQKQSQIDTAAPDGTTTVVKTEIKSTEVSSEPPKPAEIKYQG